MKSRHIAFFRALSCFLLAYGWCNSTFKAFAQHPLEPMLNIGEAVYHDKRYSVVPIISPSGYGSGTFIGKKFDSTSELSSILVVTNSHVVSYTDSAQVRHRYDTVLVRHNRYVGGIIDIKYIVRYDDQADDIAILERMDHSIPYTMLQRMHTEVTDILPDSSLQEGMTAWVMGYPLNLGVGIAQPVIQSGLISYVDRNTHVAYVDIPVNYGNSGGALYVARNGDIKLAGLVFQFNPTNIKQNTGSSVTTNSGLGKVLTGAIIDKHLRAAQFR